MNNIVEVPKADRINLRSKILVAQSLVPEMIKIVEELDYRLYVHIPVVDKPTVNVFTVILTANGNHVSYFQESIESVINQTNKHFELIVVDHGCEFELRSLIYEYFKRHENIKLIVFDINLYDPNATKFIDNRFSHVLNAALYCSIGDYVYFLSYDDFLSENYVNSMIRLFIENSNCVVAAPAVVSVDEASQVNLAKTEQLRALNLRPKYLNGITMAKSVIDETPTFAAPGGLCSYRTSLILSNGGLDAMNDLSQTFKYAILGDIGTDLDAVLYWRHHSEQTNRKNIHVGAIYYAVHVDWLMHIKNFYSIKKISEVYTESFYAYMAKRIHDTAYSSIQASMFAGLTSMVKVYVRIAIEAPKIYQLYFFHLFIKSLPRNVFNTLPVKIKSFFKKIKLFLLNK